MRLKLVKLLALAAVTCAVERAPALAQSAQGPAAPDPAAFYRGRNIDMLVASGPGGGYDAYARTIARFMGRFIPGGPNIIVRNMQGAGGKIATTYLQDIAAKDGSVILADQPGALVEPVLGDARSITYDARKFAYIGSAASFTTLCLIRSTSPIKTFAQLQTQEAIFGADNVGASTYDHALTMKNLAGAKIKVVTGYPGTNDLVLALQRNEIDGFCGYAWSSLMSRSPDLVTKKLVNLVVQFSLEPLDVATKAGVPEVWPFVKDADDRKALEVHAAVQVFGRPYLVSGAVPAERVAALRRAFEDTMKDSGFVAEMTKQSLDVSPISGNKVAELVARIYDMSPDVQAKARAALTLK